MINTGKNIVSGQTYLNTYITEFSKRFDIFVPFFVKKAIISKPMRATTNAHTNIFVENLILRLSEDKKTTKLFYRKC